MQIMQENFSTILQANQVKIQMRSTDPIPMFNKVWSQPKTPPPINIPPSPS